MRWPAIGQFFPLSPVTVPEIFAEVNLDQIHFLEWWIEVWLQLYRIFFFKCKANFIDDTQKIKTGKLFLKVIIIHLFTTTAWTNDFTITFLGLLLIEQNNIHLIAIRLS